MNEVGCKLIIYDDKNISYITGNIYEINVEPHYLEYDNGSAFKQYFETSKTYSVTTNNPVNNETIKLDDTLMKRIAKFNKEIEIKKLDETIKNKQEKIKELDNLLQDKEKRWNKVKDYIKNIYNISLEDDYDDEEYWED
jgi:hypothetical protein